MMARKLAGLFALLALLVYFATWLSHYFYHVSEAGMPRFQDSWQTGFGIAVMYFLAGLFMATLAIGLMQEVMAERRSRETERRFSARAVYDAILNDEIHENAEK